MSLWTGSGTRIYGHTKFQETWTLHGPPGLDSLIIQDWHEERAATRLKEKGKLEGRYFSGSTFSPSPSSPVLQANSEGQQEHPHPRPRWCRARWAGEEVPLIFSAKSLLDHRRRGNTGETAWRCKCFIITEHCPCSWPCSSLSFSRIKLVL